MQDIQAKVAELMADQAYSAVLSALMLVFSQSNARTGDLLRVARFAMYALDDAAHEVIRLGGAPLFSLPAFAAGDQGVIHGRRGRGCGGAIGVMPRRSSRNG